MNELALFAGHGGGLLGSHLLGWRTVCAVEIEEYPRLGLLRRQADGGLPRFPVWDDVRTFDGRPWSGRVDVITGGFPCQDISASGKGAGITGERSGLWSEMARIIGEVRPRFVLVENSPLLVSRGLDTVLGDLAALGFNAEWGVIGAHHAGAPHKRDRIWILAYAGQGRYRDEEEEMRTGWDGLVSGCNDMANTDEIRWDGRTGKQRLGRRKEPENSCNVSWWDVDPADIPDADGQGLEIDEPCEDGDEQLALVGSRREAIPDADEERLQGRRLSETEERDNPPDAIRGSRSGSEVSDPEDERILLGLGSGRDGGRPGGSGADRRGDTAEHEGRKRWPTESRVGRVAHGVAHRVDRLKTIGNGQVPAVVVLAWRILSGGLE